MTGDTLVTDSHYRIYLREEGYGFIAEATHPKDARRDIAAGDFDLRPLNKGVDLDKEVLRVRVLNAMKPNQGARTQ